MKVSGHLVPFPDSGAADLMSNNLELWVEADGSGQIRCQAHVFERTPTEITQPTQLDYKKPLEYVYKHEKKMPELRKL